MRLYVALTPFFAAVVIVLVVLAALGRLSPEKHHRAPVTTVASTPAPSAFELKVLLKINGTSPVATVDENFICATLDWWPSDKCDYGNCSWSASSILDVNLSSPLLANAVKGLSPLLIRLGGSLQDQVVYDIGNSSVPCIPFTHNSSTRLGFSGGCFSMSRWRELNEFFQKTESLVAFGLNALIGRGPKHTGSWDSTNSRDFIQYTVDQGYSIKAWELGNELAGGVGVKLNPKQYAEDVKKLRRIVEDIYNGNISTPFVIAPDSFFDYSWYKDLLQHTQIDRRQALDAVTYHVYDIGPANGLHLVDRILNATTEYQVFRDVQSLLHVHGGGARAWVGESGGIYNSGQASVSDTFVFSFWYLDQLGKAALHNTSVFCRQSLIGGNYGLLSRDFTPNPDYYSAFLWKELMGETVLHAVSNNSHLHSYAHCAKKSSGVVVLMINYNRKQKYVIEYEGLDVGRRIEYHLRAEKGEMQGKKVLVNDQVMDDIDGVSKVKGVTKSAEEISVVAPLSIVFVEIPDTFVPACVLKSDLSIKT